MTCQLCECKIGTSYTFSSDPLPCGDCGEWIEIHLETSVYRGFDEEGFHCFRLHKSKRCPSFDELVSSMKWFIPMTNIRKAAMNRITAEGEPLYLFNVLW